MGSFLSPTLQRELENLDKDDDCRKSAMKELNFYVKNLDSRAIPIFLTQFSEMNEIGSLCQEDTISLYEVLARAHGVKVAPHIDSIMSTIIKTLASSSVSSTLPEACSKVVLAIARYGIDPDTPEEEKRHTIHSLCKPLGDSLLDCHESLTSGAAFCLKALVDCDNWRFASVEIVNHVCQNVAVVLEARSNQMYSHISLVMALAKHNSLIVEAYARILIQSGLRMVKSGLAEGNSKKQLSAIQMLNLLMKYLDPRSIFSEVESVIQMMEDCQYAQTALIKVAAYETMQAARRIAGGTNSKYEKGSSSVSGSNFGRKGQDQRRNSCSNAGDQFHAFMSPESQQFKPLVESSVLMTQTHDCRSSNRNLWSNDNGRMNVPPKDGSFSELAHGFSTSDSPLVDHELTDDDGHYDGEFLSFSQKAPRNGSLRSSTPSPQSAQSRITDNMDIFTTPKNLIHSLDAASVVNSENQSRRCRTPCSRSFEMNHRDRFLNDSVHEFKENENTYNRNDQSPVSSESVSSSNDIPFSVDVKQRRHQEVVPRKKCHALNASIEKSHRKTFSRFALTCICVLIVVYSLLMCSDDQEESFHIVPT